jgi:uncharacterized NAD-dependent epimerase/dehydratase family protein
MRETAVVLSGGLFTTPSAKTAHGLVRGPSRFDVLALIDAAHPGADAGELLDGRKRAIPVHASLRDCLASGLKPQWVVVGVATSGGVLPPELRASVLEALELGIGVVNGLHELVGDDPQFTAAAQRSGARIVDVRRPKARRELHFWSGAIAQVRAPRIAVIGTDCALGKRTTAQLLVAACAKRGVRAEMIYTGQTGWLQGGRYGFVLDSTPNDFVSGELEHAIVSCERELAPDVMFLEGQSALRNPSGPCGAELLLSGGARAVVLQHAPRREFFDDQEHLHNRIPSIVSELELLAFYGARALALTLNHEHLPEAEREAARRQVERESGLRALYPLLEPLDELVELVLQHVAAERAR